MKKLIIDVGSSTVKLYSISLENELNLLETKSFNFKRGFDPKIGVDENVPMLSKSFIII